MTLTKSLRVLALEDLGSSICVCLGKKEPKRSFCGACYYILPTKLRNNLYRSFSEGYAEAWDEAKTFLKAETGRVRR